MSDRMMRLKLEAEGDSVLLFSLQVGRELEGEADWVI